MPRIAPQEIAGVAVPELEFMDSFNNGYHGGIRDYLITGNFPLIVFRNTQTATLYLIFASETTTTYTETAYRYYPTIVGTNTLPVNLTYTYDGKTVYWGYIYTTESERENALPLFPALNTDYNIYPVDPKILAWAMIYGTTIPDGYNVFYDLDNCSGDASNPLVIPINAAITPAKFYPNPGTEFVSASVSIAGTGFPETSPVAFNWTPTTGALRIGPVTSDITIHVKAFGDPYSGTDGTAPIPGGSSVSVPGLPGLTATSTGIIGLFAPSTAQMQALAGYMWTDFGGQGTTEIDVLKEIVEAIKRSISNPLDYVVGLNIIPSQGLSVEAAQEIRFGFTNTGVSMPRLSNQYFTVDCGSIYFDYLCDDTFLDYAPYSKFSIYLPYIGVKELDANDCVGHTIGVYYHGDTVTGGITAYITKDGSVMYQFSGCCALNVPLSADGWGSTIAGAVQIATSMVTGGISGGAAGVVKAAAESAASVAANPSLLSRQIAHSGAVSGGAGCMGIQYPFIIREAVSYHSTAGFNTVCGYPSFYYRSLGAVGGFTVVYDVHLQGIPATRDEIDEIETLLKEGVVF